MRQHHVLSTTTPDNCKKTHYDDFFDVGDTSCPIGKLPFSFLLCGEFLNTYFISMPQLSKYVKIPFISQTYTTAVGISFGQSHARTRNLVKYHPRVVFTESFHAMVSTDEDVCLPCER